MQNADLVWVLLGCIMLILGWLFFVHMPMVMKLIERNQHLEETLTIRLVETQVCRCGHKKEEHCKKWNDCTKCTCGDFFPVVEKEIASRGENLASS